MRGGLLVLVWVTACGFQPNHAGGDGPSAGSDAPGAGSDAPLPGDAKIYMDAPALAGSLVVTATTLGVSSVDLTAEGTTDWAHWGYLGMTGFDRMNGGTAISNLGAPPTVAFTGAPFTAAWSNGTPHMMAFTSSGVGVHQGSAMTFTVAAGTASRTLRLYAGAQAASARLDVSLSDASATAVQRTLDATGTTNVEYTITYNAASAGKTLNISWTDTNDLTGGGNSFAALLEATLQ